MSFMLRAPPRYSYDYECFNSLFSICIRMYIYPRP